MIVSLVRQRKFEKEEREGRKLTYEVLESETGLAPTTLARLLKHGERVDRIDGKTLDVLCRYFGCNVGELLNYVPEADAPAT